MKKLLLLLALCFAVFSAKAQNPSDVNKDGVVNSADVVMVYDIITNGWSEPSGTEFTVNGVSFKMISVEGGTFQMGATSEQQEPRDSEKPVHQVSLSSYMIGETEVTQELWLAVMGNNPSDRKGLKRPIENVSWNECQTFITKLNQLTGKKFRLPTEAEWEYAARGGKQSKGYQYSGSNNLDDVAWYNDNSGAKGSSHPDYGTHPVKTKQPNELGIYDLSGNVYEWCQDWYGSYNSSAQTNPTGPNSGLYRMYRGGCWYSSARDCRSADRSGHESPDRRGHYLGVRLALSEFSAKVQNPSDVNKDGTVNSADVVMVYNIITNGWSEPSDNEFTVNGVSFKMIPVGGGTFQMGATSEQQEPNDDEKPVHKVSLSSYMIGETEVTQELWQAVMGSNPSNFKGANMPVEKVSWDECQIFITILNQLTGKKFRLPTEAEWEYAARGGNKSKGYQYSGSNKLDDVAWYNNNSNSTTHPVKTKKPNELGIYDMSGNVYEWCQDCYGSYNSSTQTNPTGPTQNSGSYRVYRGGSWNYGAGCCRSAYRNSYTPDFHRNLLGVRLALSE